MFILQQKNPRTEPRAGGFSGVRLCPVLSLLCSLNWPCRSNSPRRWQPASCPARSPPQPRPSVPCQGPWPSGLPRPQPPPSSQLRSWAQLCSAPQRELSALPQDPSSLPHISPSRVAGTDFPAVTLPTPSSPQDASVPTPCRGCSCSLGAPDQSRKSWASFKGRYPSLHPTGDSTNTPWPKSHPHPHFPSHLELVLGSPAFPA